MECSKLLPVEFLHRKANALNVEPIQPLERCRLKTPEHWGSVDPEGVRWRWSGGSNLVFGRCTPNSCPFKGKDNA